MERKPKKEQEKTETNATKGKLIAPSPLAGKASNTEKRGEVTPRHRAIVNLFSAAVSTVTLRLKENSHSQSVSSSRRTAQRVAAGTKGNCEQRLIRTCQRLPPI